MLIAISGKIGSGKDTVAGIINTEVNKQFYMNFESKSFAYKLKLICSILTGTTIEENMTQEGKNRFLPEWGMTLGEMQQKIGTNCMRDNLHLDTWILALFADYNSTDDLWIITDCRFPNEADMTRKYDPDSLVIRLSGDPALVRANTKRNIYHPSETSLDDYTGFDVVIENNSTITDLETKVMDVVTPWLRKRLH